MGEEKIPNEMQEIVDEFISEGLENLAELERVFVDLERDPGNLELINTVFRAVHSLKGAADFLGFPRIVAVAHKGESLLNLLRKETLTLTAEIMDVIFAAVDMLKVLLGEIVSGTEDGGEIETLLARIDEILGTQAKDVKETVGEKGSPKSTRSDPLGVADAVVKPDPAQPLESAPPAASSVDVPVAQSMDQQPVAPAADRAALEKPQANRSTASDGNQVTADAARDHTIRVDVSRLDSVMNLVRTGPGQEPDDQNQSGSPGSLWR